MTTARHRVAWIASGVVAALVLALVAGEASGWPFLQQPLRDGLQRATGVPVQLQGRFHAHLLWRPRLQIEQLTVGSAADVPATHLIEGRQVALSWRWADLWRWQHGGELTLRSLRADTLDVQTGAFGRRPRQLADRPRARGAACPRPAVAEGRTIGRWRRPLRDR